jgi:stage IV sporulation protein FB
MLFFQSPPPTRFDLRFSFFGIPVRVHPLFWLIALILGSSGSFTQIMLWILVIFISILIHEMGHALAFRTYGQGSQIVLYVGGGLTIPETVSWGSGYASVAPSPMQQIIITLAGPFAGFLLAALTVAGVIFTGGSVAIGLLFGFIPIPQLTALPVGGNLAGQFISLMLWVNIFWGLVNLLPVFPLDGGQVARNILIQYDPLDGTRKSLWLSVITGGLIALAGLLVLHSVYMAFLFGLLAFQSYQSLSIRY